MKRPCTLLGILLGILLFTPWPALAQEGPRAFVGARLIPIDAAEISDGVLLIDVGKIITVGPRASTPIPSGCEQIDVSGKTIMPGLVDTHSHIGGIGGADGAGPIQPGVEVFESLDVHAAGFRRALAGGLTTLNIMPGSGHLVSGKTIYVKLRPAHVIDDMFIRNADGAIAGGLKMANGTNMLRDAPFPGTRGKSAALVREQFIKAQEYVEKKARAGDDPEKIPPRDLGLECLAEVLAGKRVVHHHTHRHDDIMTVLRLQQEFGFRVVLHHVSEGWRVAREIADAGVPCSIILVDSPGGKLEAQHLVMGTGAALEQAGVLVAFHTDDWINDSRLFMRMAALGVRAGMSRDKALEALTLSGAKMLDLDDRIGSLTPGKDADFAVLSGDPFSTYTKVEQTWIEGAIVFDRSKPEDRLHAVGGYGAGDDTEPYLCCRQQTEDSQ